MKYSLTPIECHNCKALYLSGIADGCPYCAVEACNKNIAEFVTKCDRYREALGKIISEGDYSSPEGMKLIARKALEEKP